MPLRSESLDSVVLDLALALILVGFLVAGYRSGLARNVGGIVGVFAGAVGAFFLVPLVGGWVPDPAWRTPATLAAALLLILTGLSIGIGVGRAIRSRIDRTPLRPVDRVLGALVAAIAAALVASVLAASIGSLGVPFLAPAIAGSRVLRTIDGLTPVQAKAYIAQARAFVVQEGFPRIVEAFEGPVPQLPDAAPANAALTTAAASVVKITGTAYSCGRNQSGSGFVIADDRVLTNAHVVAGVVEPVVETPEGQALAGRIVYFDPIDDLAVIRLNGLTAQPLLLADPLPVGAVGVVDGYPFGGPFDSDPAEVIAVGTQLVPDIHGNDPTAREVYTLASDVQQGESGGPLLSDAGLVAGVVFAKAADAPNVGYALTLSEVKPVATGAAALVEPVSSGGCVEG